MNQKYGKKRVLALLMALALIVGLLPQELSASAEQSANTPVLADVAKTTEEGATVDPTSGTTEDPTAGTTDTPTGLQVKVTYVEVSEENETGSDTGSAVVGEENQTAKESSWYTANITPIGTRMVALMTSSDPTVDPTQPATYKYTVSITTDGTTSVGALTADNVKIEYLVDENQWKAVDNFDYAKCSFTGDKVYSKVRVTYDGISFEAQPTNSGNGEAEIPVVLDSAKVSLKCDGVLTKNNPTATVSAMLDGFAVGADSLVWELPEGWSIESNAGTSIQASIPADGFPAENNQVSVKVVGTTTPGKEYASASVSVLVVNSFEFSLNDSTGVTQKDQTFEIDSETPKLVFSVKSLGASEDDLKSLVTLQKRNGTNWETVIPTSISYTASDSDSTSGTLEVMFTPKAEDYKVCFGGADAVVMGIQSPNISVAGPDLAMADGVENDADGNPFKYYFKENQNIVVTIYDKYLDKSNTTVKKFGFDEAKSLEELKTLGENVVFSEGTCTYTMTATDDNKVAGLEINAFNTLGGHSSNTDHKEKSYVVDTKAPEISFKESAVPANTLTDESGKAKTRYYKGKSIQLSVIVEEANLKTDETVLTYKLDGDTQPEIRFSELGDKLVKEGAVYTYSIDVPAGHAISDVKVSAVDWAKHKTEKLDSITYVVDNTAPSVEVRITGDNVAGVYTNTDKKDIYVKFKTPVEGDSGITPKGDPQKFILRVDIKDANLAIEGASSYQVPYFVQQETKDKDATLAYNEQDGTVTYIRELQVNPDDTGVVKLDLLIQDLAGNKIEQVSAVSIGEGDAKTSFDDLLTVNEGRLTGTVVADRTRPSSLENGMPQIVLTQKDDVKTEFETADGIPLYNTSTSFDLTVMDPDTGGSGSNLYSGLDSVTWSIQDEVGLVDSSCLSYEDKQLDGIQRKEYNIPVNLVSGKQGENNKVTISITAKDKAGNMIMYTHYLALDTESPRIQITGGESPMNTLSTETGNIYYYQNTQDIVIKVTDLNLDTANTTITYKLNGKDTQAADFTKSENTYTWTIQIPENGEISDVQVTAKDLATHTSSSVGDSANDISKNTYIIDGKDPVVTVGIAGEGLKEVFDVNGKIYAKFDQPATGASSVGATEPEREITVTVKASDANLATGGNYTTANYVVNNIASVNNIAWEGTPEQNKESLLTYTQTITVPADANGYIPLDLTIQDLAGNKPEVIATEEDELSTSFGKLLTLGTENEQPTGQLTGTIIADRTRPTTPTPEASTTSVPEITLKAPSSQGTVQITAKESVPVYNANVEYGLDIEDPQFDVADEKASAGLSLVKWEIGDLTGNTVTEKNEYNQLTGKQSESFKIPVIANGKYETNDVSIQLTAQDQVGNTTTYEEKLAVDTLAPRINVEEPDEEVNSVNNTYYFQEPQKIVIEVEDLNLNPAATTLTYTISDGLNAGEPKTLVFEDKSVTKKGNVYRYELPVQLGSTVSNVKVEAFDYATNRSTDTRIQKNTYVVDNTPATIEISAPTTGVNSITDTEKRATTYYFKEKQNIAIRVTDVNLDAENTVLSYLQNDGTKVEKKTLAFNVKDITVDGAAYTYSLAVPAGSAVSNIQVVAEDYARNGSKDISDHNISCNTYVVDDTAPTATISITGKNLESVFTNNNNGGGIYLKFKDPATGASGAKSDGETQTVTLKVKVTDANLATGGDYDQENFVTNNVKNGITWTWDDTPKLNSKNNTLTYTQKLSVAPDNNGYFTFNLTIQDLAGNMLKDIKADDVGNTSFKDQLTLDKGTLGGTIISDRSRPSSTNDFNPPVITLTENQNPVNTVNNADGESVHLYNASTSYTLKVTDPSFDVNKYSGLESVVWEVKDPIGLTSTSGNENKNLGGDQSATYTVPVTAGGANETNDVVINVTATDQAGNATTYVHKLAMDTLAPRVKVSYNNNSVQNERYFKEDRLLTVTIEDLNFAADRTTLTTERGVSGWSQNGNVYTATVNYNADGDYTFNMATADKAANAGTVDYTNGGANAAPQSFTVDKTVPVISVSYNNNSSHNGKYYKENRIASVTINEHNFNAAAVVYNGTASLDGNGINVPSLNGWSNNGDNRGASISFDKDGDYSFTINYTDQAGNVATAYVENEFTVDTTAPVIKINGVDNNTAYRGSLRPTIDLSDVNFDTNGYQVTLSRRDVNGSKAIEYSASEASNAHGLLLTLADLAHELDNDGIYTLNVTLTDKAGNMVTDSRTYSLNRFGSTYYTEDLDTQNLLSAGYANKAPMLKVIEINPDKLTEYGISLSVNGSTQALVEGTDFTVEKLERNGEWKQYIYTIYESAFLSNEELTEGDYVVTLTSMDTAGNANSNRTNTNELPMLFTIDTTEPVVSLTGILEGDTIRESSRDITVYFSDSSDVNRVEIYLNGEVVKVLEGEELAAANGSYTITANESSEDQEVYAIVTDAAGNQTVTESLHFYLNSSTLQQFFHNTPLVIGVGVGLLALFALIFFLVFKRRKKDEQ